MTRDLLNDIGDAEWKLNSEEVSVGFFYNVVLKPELLFVILISRNASTSSVSVSMVN